jgi:anhydro-N-acetylmuramic acid kinase
LNKTPLLYLGVMSGTSIDGADVILADLAGAIPRVIGFHSAEFPSGLRAELLALNTAGGNEVERSHLAANALVDVYARAIASLLATTGVTANDVIAIGCHGQTIRHRPELGYTVQLNNSARLAELTSITTVADFRSRDIAAGGQGAPLVPAFHDGVFRAKNETRVVVNIGGIANISVLDKDKPVWGFDCGPGNCLMDAWNEKHRRGRFDGDGAWAASGQVLGPLSTHLLREKYLLQSPPKSTGRDLFNLQWLDQQLNGNENPADVQATLLDLTATSIANDITRFAPECDRVLICGGGAQNSALMRRIAEKIPNAKMDKTDAFGVPAQQVEALAFAWLAKQAIEHRAVDLRTTTGARHAAILGAIYPA